MKLSGSAAQTAFYYKKIHGLSPNWQLKYKLKCKSTEYELSNWLKNSHLKINQPIAFIAKEQFSGFGQKSRHWLSPRGGIWLSAAYPIFSKNFAIKIFSLSFAIKLCEMLKMESIRVDLKWPNDIFFGSKKLIGFLPKVITRGEETIYVRIGLGMNLSNKTPPNGISLSKILNTKYLCEYYWTAKILKAINESIEINSEDRKKYIIKKTNEYLTKNYLPTGYSSDDWRIRAVDQNGNLEILNKDNEERLIKF